MTIKLDSIDSIPSEFLEELKTFDSTFKTCDFIEQVLKNKKIEEIVWSLNDICLEQGLIGFHYTRAVREEIRQKGLILSTGEDRRRLFIEKYVGHFSIEQVQRISNYWRGYFNKLQSKVRDNRIWFAFTLLGLQNGGVEPLLTYFVESKFICLLQMI